MKAASVETGVNGLWKTGICPLDPIVFWFDVSASRESRKTSARYNGFPRFDGDLDCIVVESVGVSGLQKQVCISFTSDIRPAADVHFKHLRLLPMAREWKKAVKRTDSIKRQRYLPVRLIRENWSLLWIQELLNGDCFQCGCGDAGRKKVGGRTNLDKN